MIDYSRLKERVLGLLEKQLPQELHYHGMHHTLDVLNVCEEYISRDNISESEANLLRTGALFHDFGFTRSFENHEQNGARLVEKILPDFGFGTKDIEVVQGLIMATRIPQTPATQLERIICDADLDYLGRDDYYPISETLYEELTALEKIENRQQWVELQIRFLEAHEYHTDFARENRQSEKEKRISELKAGAS